MFCVMPSENRTRTTVGVAKKHKFTRKEKWQILLFASRGYALLQDPSKEKPLGEYLDKLQRKLSPAVLMEVIIFIRYFVAEGLSERDDLDLLKYKATDPRKIRMTTDPEHAVRCGVSKTDFDEGVRQGIVEILSIAQNLRAQRGSR